MADIAFSLLIRSLRVFEAYIQENVHLLLGVGAEFEMMRMEMEHMQAFLRASYSREDNDALFGVWVDQIRKLAYETEDVIDEFIHHLARHDEPELCACFLRNLKARHRIASDIKSIKSKVGKISEARKKYNESSVANPAVEEGNSNSQLRGNARLLVGIEEAKQDLIWWLVEGSPWAVVIPVFGMALGWWGKSSRAVISVVGMPGSGKTTLARQAYDDSVVKRSFKIQAWIKVSKSSKIESVLTHILEQIYTAVKKPVPDDVRDMQSEELSLRINKLLVPQKYLIVLDDVWENNVWDVIRYAFPDNNYGSRVIITTWIEAVARGGGVYRVKALSEEHCWSLFCRKAFQDGTCPPHLTDICKSIVSRLEGSPLAVEAVSGILATKDVSMIHEWQLISDNLRLEIGNSDGLQTARKAISLSFKDLPYHLKSCFLYLGIFPDDHPIECTRVVHLWKALGFVIVSQSDQRTPEQVAEEYLQELQNRSLIQRSETTSDGRVKSWRIHNLVREFIVSKSRKQNFTAIATGEADWQENFRHVSVVDNLHDGKERRAVPKLRSFLAFNGVNPINNFSSDGFRLLNVLDLKGAKTLEVFPDDVVTLFHLKYLSLRDTKIREIPRSIKKLGYLETLDLKGTFVTQLPVEIQELKNLRQLLVYRYEFRDYPRFSSKFGFKTSADVGCLQSLQKLCFIEADRGSNLIMPKLAKLTQLTRLGIINLTSEHGEALCLSLQSLKKLRVLSVTSSEDGIINLSGLTGPLRHMQRLYLTGGLQNVPQWIPSLPNLAKLVLKSSKLEGDPLESIQDLASLVHLELQQVFQGESMRFRTGGFKKLKVLGIYELNGLKSVTVEEGAMPCLEILTLHRCRLLLKVPYGLEHLPVFKKLEYSDMPTEFVPALYPGAQVEDRMNNFRQSHSCVFVILYLIALFVMGMFVRF